jgi:sugar (pentulose or hexulose) kinase
MKGIITVDIGTTSMRAILYDGAGQALHMDQRRNMPEFFSDGRVEQDPTSWQQCLIAILVGCQKMATAKGIAPMCISVTAQRSSVIAVDRLGVPLHPAIMWQDSRCAEMALAMEPSNDLVYGKTGLKISPVFSAIKMTWLRRNRPDIWRHTHKLIGVQDWVMWLLTGRFVTDQSLGSRTNLLNLTTRTWDPELLDLFEVPQHMLCDLMAPGDIAGGLSASMSAATGLQTGLPVVSAGGDQQCAALGLGLFSSEHAVTNTGTGSYLIGHSNTPALDASMRVSCNVSAIPGAYIVEAALLTSGAIYRWFSESLLGAQDDASSPFDQLNEEARLVAPGSNGLMLIPHFKGCATPYWDPDARGVFYNLSLSTTRGEMVRSIFEGIAIELKESLVLVEDLCGTVASVSVSGGMTKSAVFNQIQSDVFERPVQRLSSDEASSRGAWIAAAVTLGLEASYASAFNRSTQRDVAVIFQPNHLTQSTYQRQRQRARAIYQALAAPEIRELFK